MREGSGGSEPLSEDGREQRGWARESKRDLCDIATDLAYETDDAQEAMTLYGAAEGGFAIKFYGSHHTSWLVKGGLDDARKWISLMESRYRPQRKVRLSQMDRERERQWNMEQKERMAKSGNRFADVGKRPLRWTGTTINITAVYDSIGDRQSFRDKRAVSPSG